MKLRLQNLTKIFPNRVKGKADVTAVNNFDFEIPDGKLVGLLGPSGCGKSTTLYMISGLQKPSSGKIFFGEQDVTELSPEHRGVGLVFQNYALYPHMTVKQNILFPLQNLKGADKLPKEEMLEKAYEAARLVQIDDLMERKPSELSGGQQQRVAIARALVKMPRVLLLDEPLSNLDARLRLQTREEIKRIQKETKITTVFVTHDQDEAMSISDIIVVMKRGVVQQIGEPQDVYDSPDNLFVAKFLGVPPINVLKGIVKGDTLYIGDEEIMKVNYDFDSHYRAKLELFKEELAKFDAEHELREQTMKASMIEAIKAERAPIAEKVNLYEMYVKTQAYIVSVGVRPEGFVLNPNGKLTLNVSNIEVMGRDVSVITTHPESLNPIVRSIIPAENRFDITGEKVKFDLKPAKVFLFNAETEERFFYEVK